MTKQTSLQKRELTDPICLFLFSFNCFWLSGSGCLFWAVLADFKAKVPFELVVSSFLLCVQHTSPILYSF